MLPKRFRFADDFAIFDDFFNFSRPTFSFLKGELYDPEQFDLTPKPAYLEAEIKRKEEAIEENERNHEASNKYYESRKRLLIEEKERLINQRGKKK
jgi:hypothetical protein